MIVAAEIAEEQAAIPDLLVLHGGS